MTLACLVAPFALSAQAHAQIALLKATTAESASGNADGLVGVVSTPGVYGHAVTLADAAFEAAVGETLTLKLPNRPEEKFVLTDLRHEIYGTTLIGAPAATPKANRVLIVRSGSYAFGRIERDGKVWYIEPAADGALALIPSEAFGKALGLKNDQVLPNPDIQALRMKRPLPSFSSMGPQRPTNIDPVLDIALFYTPGIVEAYGLGTQARMGLIFEVFRKALQDSNAGVTAELVHLGLQNYSDTVDISTALDDLRLGNTTANGDLSQATPIAAAKGADLIHLVRRFRAGQDICGIAYLLGSNADVYEPDPEFAYGVTGDGSQGGRGCLASTLAHEIGHNLGLTHDNKNASNPCDNNVPKDGRGDGVQPWSCGFNSNGIAGASPYRTIMAYDIERETEQLLFSNPQIMTCGNGTEICGAIETDLNPADAARTLREQSWKASLARERVDQLVSAVLPSSRSISSTGTASVFATMINPGADTATNCRPVIAGLPDSRFSYQTTNAQNALIGSANTPVNVPAGAAQSFVVGVTASGVQNVIDVFIDFQCDNRRQASVIPGVNTLTFSSSASGTQDIIAIASTLSGDGVVRIPGVGGVQAFALAAVNIASTGGTMRVQPFVTGNESALVVTVCDTTGSSVGSCAALPSSSVSVSANTNEVRTFSLFVTANASVPFDPAVNRIRVSLRDVSDRQRGATSVAVTTQ